MGKMKHSNGDDNAKPLKRVGRILGNRLKKAQGYGEPLFTAPTKGVEGDITTVGCPAIDGMRGSPDKYDAGLTTASGIIPPETTRLSNS